MNQQYLEYVRCELISAFSDSITRRKGQLSLLERNAILDKDDLKRKPQRYIFLDDDPFFYFSSPMKCVETRTKQNPFPLIDEKTFRGSFWRRALGLLDLHFQNWIYYCYGFDLGYDGQITICKYVWNRFCSLPNKKR